MEELELEEDAKKFRKAAEIIRSMTREHERALEALKFMEKTMSDTARAFQSGTFTFLQKKRLEKAAKRTERIPEKLEVLFNTATKLADLTGELEKVLTFTEPELHSALEKPTDDVRGYV